MLIRWIAVPTACRFGLHAIALLVFLVAVSWPSLGRAGLFSPSTFYLDNGLQVIVIEDHRAPVVRHMVWYRVGAADEPVGKSGVAHLLEHLMFKGTDKIPNGEFSRIIARNGGQDNAFTAQDYTGYFQTIARDKLDLVMGMEADRMVNLRFDADDFEAERQVVLEERRARTDNDPGAQLAEATRATQYFAHPYGIPVIGWEHEIRALTREDVLSFYRLHYAPNNAILIVAGDIRTEEVRDLAETHFGGTPAIDVPKRWRPAEPPHRAARRVVFKDPRVRQPSVQRSYLAPARRGDSEGHALPLQVFSEILGGGTTSRLYRALVVEQKAASGAGAWYQGLSYDQTTFGVYASPVPGGDVAKLETAMDDVLRVVLRDGVTEAEVKRAKNGLLASAIYARDNLGTGPRIFGAALTAGLSITDVETWTDRIRSITQAQVMAAARMVLDERRSVTGVLLPEAGK